jgi:hypothetical protein
LGRLAPEGLLGIHVSVLAQAIGLKDQLPAESEQGRAAHTALKTFLTDGFSGILEQSTRPQTVGYSLLDSPVGLRARWRSDTDREAAAERLVDPAGQGGRPMPNPARAD